MESRPKSSEIIQAQIAAFTAERIEHSGDTHHVMRNIGNLALGNADNITRTVGRRESGWRNDDAFGTLPQGSQRTVTDKRQYVDYLRSVGGSQHEVIRGRADILAAYDRFTPVIAALKDDLAASDQSNEDRPDFIGSGTVSSVFRITDGGQQYAARIPNDIQHRAKWIDNHVEAAAIAKGIPGMEQIVAASYEDGVTIADILPGKRLGELTLDEMPQISDQHLHELITTLTAATNRNIVFDYHDTANVVYDQDVGFGLLDYTLPNATPGNHRDIDMQKVHSAFVSGMIGFMGSSNKKYRREPSVRKKYVKAQKLLAERYMQIVDSQD